MQTLFYNNDIARLHNGTCYAIIDDRQDHDRSDSIKEDFDYLGLQNTQIVSVYKYQTHIYSYTKKLIDSGKISLVGSKGDIRNMWEQLNTPTCAFQMRLLLDSGTYANIGYSREFGGQLQVVLVFDYIVKVMDILLDITDIISTTTDGADSDVKDTGIAEFFHDQKIRHHTIETYRINGFKYSKKDWPITDEHNPHLLTIKGLYNRHVPAIVLYAFYVHATQMGSIQISYLDSLLRTYLSNNSVKVFGIIDPLRIIIDDWPHRTTEFVCKTDGTHMPLSNDIYIDKSDFGLDISKLNKGRSCRLRWGQVLTCTDIEIGDRGPVLLHAKYETSPDRVLRNMHWISNVWGQDPIKVCYYLYNWFYTGNNTIVEPWITTGYIDPSVFQNLNTIFHIERSGYFIYDRSLSEKKRMPTFVRISKN